MKRNEVDRIRFSNHLVRRFAERFGDKYGLTVNSSRADVARRLFRILSEATDILPSDPFYSVYCDQRYGSERMVKGCGIVFFIREQNITTCIPSESPQFQKPKDKTVVNGGAFSLGECLTNRTVFDKVLS